MSDPEPEAPLEPATRKMLDAGAPEGHVAQVRPTCHKSQAMFATYTSGVLMLACRKCRRAVIAFKIAEE